MVEEQEKKNENFSFDPFCSNIVNVSWILSRDKVSVYLRLVRCC